MNKVSVNKGDVFLIRSGLIHSIGKGSIIAEIQQNSDTTYRVYDYGRGKELHIEKAMDVIDLSLQSDRCTGIKMEEEEFGKTFLCSCKEFSLELYDIRIQAEESSNAEEFFIFTVVDGNGEIVYEDGSEKLQKGSSIFIPASLGRYIIKGKMKLLKSYVT